MNLNKPPGSRDPGRSALNAQEPGELTELVVESRKAGPAGRPNICYREVAEILSGLNLLPEVRDSVVEEIRQRIAAGTYNIDADKIADAILKSL